MHGVVNSAAYCDGRRVTNVEIDDISEALKQPDRFVWIGLHEPSEENLGQIQREFGLHEMVDNARELLTTALEANFSLISIAQNNVSKKFAGWAAIIAVPTMIAGIYGMNFKFMPELDWIYGYPLALTLTLGSSGVLFLLFKRSGWL